MFKKIYSTKINVAANFAGSIWSALLGIAFVPVYLRYIGVEAYGLIGIFTSVQAFIYLLDFGLSPTLNRELARLAALENQTKAMRDLTRTLETVNWIVALVIAAFLSAISPLIATYWVQPKTLSSATITQALLIMSVTIAVQFSSSFYIGGLLGLQKQLNLNIVNIVCGTLRSFGAFLVVSLVSPTIQAFLIWQFLIAVVQLVSLFLLLRFSLPDSPDKSVFQKEILRKVWRFAAGMTGITVVSLVLTQTDKIILSRMLDLEMFGYYSLAVTIANMAVLTAVSAINNATFPKFSQYVSRGDESSLAIFYHRSCQITAAILIPVVVLLTFFSYQILLVWTNKEEIANNTYLLMSLIAIGTGLNGLMWLPYHLMLAYGWTQLTFYVNLAAVCILIPAMIIGVYQYGAIGGAAAWIGLNLIYILVTIQIMHKRILKNQMFKWYFEDLIVPTLVAVSIVGIEKILMPTGISRIENAIIISAGACVAILLTALSTKAGRQIIQAVIYNLNIFARNLFGFSLKS